MKKLQTPSEVIFKTTNKLDRDNRRYTYTNRKRNEDKSNIGLVPTERLTESLVLTKKLGTFFPNTFQ